MKPVEEALIKASELIKKELGIPADVFVPTRGWIMLDGKITELGRKFIENPSYKGLKKD
jgi:hypothetical protein